MHTKLWIIFAALTLIPGFVAADALPATEICKNVPVTVLWVTILSVCLAVFLLGCLLHRIFVAGMNGTGAWSSPFAGLLAFVASVAPLVIYGLAMTFFFLPLTPDACEMRADLGKPPALLVRPADKAPDRKSETPLSRSFKADIEYTVGAFKMAVSAEHAAGKTAAKLPDSSAMTPGDILAADLAARSRWMLASLGLMLTAGVSVLVGFWVAVTAATETTVQTGEGTGKQSSIARCSPCKTIGFLVIPLAMALAGGVLGSEESKAGRLADPLREIVADCRALSHDPQKGGCPLNLAQNMEHGMGRASFSANKTLSNAQNLIWWNATIGTATTGFLAGCFGILAWPIPKPGPRELRRRRRNYFLLLGASALLLSFVVAASHAYYHWGAALVVAADAKYLTSLAGTVSAQWGFLYTVILIVTAGATALSLHQTISEVGEKTVENTEKSLDTWLKDNGLAFTPASGLSAFLLTLAPLATTPFLDALKTLFA